jgi:hypothetical protein
MQARSSASSRQPIREEVIGRGPPLTNQQVTAPRYRRPPNPDLSQGICSGDAVADSGRWTVRSGAGLRSGVPWPRTAFVAFVDGGRPRSRRDGTSPTARRAGVSRDGQCDVAGGRGQVARHPRNLQAHRLLPRNHRPRPQLTTLPCPWAYELISFPGLAGQYRHADLLSPKAGRRLVAYLSLVADPDPSHAEQLTRTLTEREGIPYNQSRALRALSRTADTHGGETISRKAVAQLRRMRDGLRSGSDRQLMLADLVDRFS